MKSIIAQKKREIRREQKCVFCRNHNFDISKKGHKNDCLYNNDSHIKLCIPCKQTQQRQKSTALEKKNNYKKNQIKLSPIENFTHTHDENRTRAEQKCKKCLNHDLNMTMKNHLKDCEFKNCQCPKCQETDSRRKAVKEEAKARREKMKIIYEQNDSPRSFDSGYSNNSPQSDYSFNFEENYHTVNFQEKMFSNLQYDLTNQNLFFERSMSPTEIEFFDNGNNFCHYSMKIEPSCQETLDPSTLEDFEFVPQNVDSFNFYGKNVCENMLKEFEKEFLQCHDLKDLSTEEIMIFNF